MSSTRSGRFVSGILPEQVTAYEDAQPVPLKSMTETVVPLQLTLAINPGPALATRDKLGMERFESVVAALSAWVQALPADSADDMSLVSSFRADHLACQRPGLAGELASPAS